MIMNVELIADVIDKGLPLLVVELLAQQPHLIGEPIDLGILRALLVQDLLDRTCQVPDGAAVEDKVHRHRWLRSA